VVVRKIRVGGTTAQLNTMLLPVYSQLQATITLHSTPEFKQYTGMGGTAAQLSTMLLPVICQLQVTITLHSTAEFKQ
jgi:hypothetical protein